MQISLNWRLTLWWLRVRKCILAGSEEGEEEEEEEEEEEVVPSLKVRQRQRVCLQAVCVCKERRKRQQNNFVLESLWVCVGLTLPQNPLKKHFFKNQNGLWGGWAFVAF